MISHQRTRERADPSLLPLLLLSATCQVPIISALKLVVSTVHGCCCCCCFCAAESTTYEKIKPWYERNTRYHAQRCSSLKYLRLCPQHEVFLSLHHTWYILTYIHDRKTQVRVTTCHSCSSVDCRADCTAPRSPGSSFGYEHTAMATQWCCTQRRLIVRVSPSGSPCAALTCRIARACVHCRPRSAPRAACQPSAKEKEKEEAMALGPDRVPENQKREVYERVRRAVEAKAGACTSHKVCNSL